MAHSKLRAIKNLSSKDQSRPECYLCGKRNAGYMSAFASWNDDLKSFVTRHLLHPPPNDILVCKKDLLESRHHHLNSNYIQNGNPKQ